MSWISRAENLLNNIDSSVASLVNQNQQNKSDENNESPQKGQSLLQSTTSMPRVPSKNMLILSKSSITKPKVAKSDIDDTLSEKSISSSKHTVIENEEDSYLEMIKPATSVESFNVEKELAATKIILQETKIENGELKMEIDALQEQLQLKSNANNIKNNELEDIVAILTDEKRNLILMNQSLENSNTNYIKTISELESNLLKSQQIENELKQKLEYARSETKDTNTELQNYKLRAQNQLQMKEKIIEQLKAGNLNDSNIPNDLTNDSTTLQIEIDQLRNERDDLQKELSLLTKRLDDSKRFIEKLEHKHRISEASSEDKISSLNELIHDINLKCTQYEDEIRLQKQEITHVREEMLKQKTFMTTKVHEKENELKRIKNAYRETQANTEIENRVKSLTQSLITKQNNLEAITAEKNALRLQYEKLSVQHEELIMQMRSHRPQININMNETDDVKSISNFLTINPFDSSMRRKVKRAYSNIDQLGIRFSAFLRQYPLARTFSVFYVILLHLFVFLVILQSTPSQ